MNNGSKGSDKLASILQGRMSNVSSQNKGIIVERGEIVNGKGLKISSVPGATLDTDDYTVCATIRRTLPCQSGSPINAGDKVLVLWTYDGEPVIIDKIVEANMKGANPTCGWNNTCPKVAELEKQIKQYDSKFTAMQNKINGYDSTIEKLNGTVKQLEQRIEELKNG